MSEPSFPNSLSEGDRQDQLNILTYALAEAQLKKAEEKVLSDIGAATATADPGAIQSVLSKAQGFTNCRILQLLARLILDKRPVTLEVPEEVKIKQLQARIGDMAVSAFTGLLGTKVTGEKDVESKPHTDAELEGVYRRVKKALDSRKFSTCPSLRFE
jgi:hypothetical protein